MPIGYVQLNLAPPHDRWAARAERDLERVRRALGPACAAVHHVGSTSVPGLHAVPVLDIVAELADGLLADAVRLRLMVHGYVQAEPQFGPPSASCVLFVVEDALAGHRGIELRCYPAGHDEVRGLLAFFAYLRAAPAVAAAYDAMKRDGRARHGAGAPAYHAAKQAWMQQHDAAARDAWTA